MASFPCFPILAWLFDLDPNQKHIPKPTVTRNMRKQPHENESAITIQIQFSFISTV
jgi:hypothetical protein